MERDRLVTLSVSSFLWGFCGLLVMGMSKAPSRLMGLGVHANSLRFGFVVIQ